MWNTASLCICWSSCPAHKHEAKENVDIISRANVNAPQRSSVRAALCVWLACPNRLEDGTADVKLPPLLAQDGFDSFAYQSNYGAGSAGEHARASEAHTHSEGEETGFDLSNPQDIFYQGCRRYKGLSKGHCVYITSRQSIKASRVEIVLCGK